MTTILHVNSSAQLSERSLTRRLGNTFIQRWRAHEPGVQIIDRDVGKSPIMPIDQDFIAAAFTPPKQRTAKMAERLTESDTLIDEVSAADIIVLGVPMYNYGMPASLKGWIDQVARIGKTFSFDLSRGDFPIEPILQGKKLVVLSARGEFGFHKGGIRESVNALDTGINACAHYWGVARQDIHRAIIEYQEFKDKRYEQSVKVAHTKAENIADLLHEELQGRELQRA